MCIHPKVNNEEFLWIMIRAKNQESSIAGYIIKKYSFLSIVLNISEIKSV
tara:strand:- start:439 stop:588 length:150 start_codon:yes stop_codon:yes gene_type:complete